MRTLKTQGCKYHRHWSSQPRPTLPFETALHCGSDQWRCATVLSWTAGSAAFPIVVVTELPEASPAHWPPVVVDLFDITGHCAGQLGPLRERHAAFALLHPHPWEEPYYLGECLNGSPVRIPGVLEIGTDSVIVGVITDVSHSSSRAMMWNAEGRPLGSRAADNPEANRLNLDSLRPGPSPQLEEEGGKARAVERVAEREAAFERGMALRRRTPKRHLKPRDPTSIIDN